MDNLLLVKILFISPKPRSLYTPEGYIHRYRYANWHIRGKLLISNILRQNSIGSTLKFYNLKSYGGL